MRRDVSGKSNGGFSLIAVIFMIAVLGTIAVFMATTSSRSQIEQQQYTLASRAYQAAHAGLEWGIYQAVVNGAGDPTACNSAGSFSPAGLVEFTVTVTCTSSTHRDSTSDILIFVIDSVATTGTAGSLQYATRQMRAKVSPSGPL